MQSIPSGAREDESIICTDSDTLSKRSEEATEETIQATKVVERLVEALDSKELWCPAIALCAIQIGVPLRVFVYVPNRIDESLPKEPVAIINPVVTNFSNLRPIHGEGCLSIPYKRYLTHRYAEVTIRHGLEGLSTWCAKGLAAQMIQHEIDHMDGILCSTRTKVPGRNESCPCASGKKFKKCHGV